jgi:RimJ/RimL family protein N-acetyltransferase
LESFRLKKEHIQWVRGWRNSEFVNREMDFRAFITAEQQVTWFSNLNPNTDFYFIHRYRGEWVGLSHVLIPSSTDNGNSESPLVGENGGFLNDERWKSSGISLAIAIHTLDYAFYQLGVSLLRIKVNKQNRAALELTASLGYRRTCSLTDEFDQFELPIGEYEQVSPRLRKLLRFL